MNNKIKNLLVYTLLVAGMLLILVQTIIIVPRVTSIYQTWNILTTDYVKKEDIKPGSLYLKAFKGAFLASFDPELSISEGAIKSMLEVVDDPFTTYLDRQNNLDIMKYLAGDTAGIGIRIVINDSNQLMVLEPIPGSPADKAGIKAGDVIYEIDNQSTEGITVMQARDRLLGKEDTEVTIVFGQDENHKNSVVLQREILPTVISSIIEDNIIYLRIYSFSENTANDVNSQLDKLLSNNQDIKGIIIDLRDNPGGLVTSVVNIASEFLDEGTVIFYEANSKLEIIKTHSASIDGIARDPNLRIAVLINGNSASASEILAGALSDERINTRIIGLTSFGKGSVNHLLPLKDGSAFYVTSSYWLTPKKNSISQVGIVPDIEINDENEQFDYAIDYIQGNI